MPQLIVNADDYGLTRGINRAVERLFRSGPLTSATLMAGTANVEEAAEFARANPKLGVGCHIVLIDGDPVAEPAQIASLLRPGSRTLCRGMEDFLPALFTGAIRSSHIQIEAAAQLNRLRKLGIQPTHVDTHKHMHMFPAVLRAVLAAASEAGVKAVRNPFEPAWAVSAARNAGIQRRLQVSALRALFSRQFATVVRNRGFVTTDGTIGVSATGSLDHDTLRNLVHDLPEGTWELVCHPGHPDAELEAVNTRLRESRETEAACLGQLASLVKPGTRLMNFGDMGT